MKHVMIDLETLGTEVTAVWLSIAAIQFDPVTGEMGKRFSATVDLKSAQAAGRTINPDTLKWWLEQKPEIMAKMLNGERESFITTLARLHAWVRENQLYHPWCNSASFDLGMLVHSYQSVDMTPPWAFFNEKCYRTVAGLVSKGAAKNALRAHDPMYDCEYQIENLHRAYKLLKLC